MAGIPEVPSDQQKEALLQKSPLLRTFLDRTSKDLDPTKWMADLQRERQSLLNEVDSKIGKNSRVLVLETLTISLPSGIFSKDFTPNEEFGYIAILILIGYELDHVLAVDMFFPDVGKELAYLKAFDPSTFGNSKGEVATDLVKGLMHAGAYLKVQSFNQDPFKPDPFKNFLEGLDLSGI